MTTFVSQITAARHAHSTVNALEVAAREKVDKILKTGGTLVALEKVVTDSYQASVSLALAQANGQSEIPDWSPVSKVITTPYLDSLLTDVKRNWSEYGSSVKDDVAKRRLALRVQHSAGVGVQRGYTDAMVAAYGQMADLGVVVHKVWTANFVNHTPCPRCYALSGMEVGLHESFPAGDHSPYVDLLGPPEHPHCQCVAVLVTQALENVGERITPDTYPKPATPPAVPQDSPVTPSPRPAPLPVLPVQPPPTKKPEMASKTVRSMAGPVFVAFLAFLAKIIKMLVGK